MANQVRSASVPFHSQEEMELGLDFLFRLLNDNGGDGIDSLARQFLSNAEVQEAITYTVDHGGEPAMTETCWYHDWHQRLATACAQAAWNS